MAIVCNFQGCLNTDQELHGCRCNGCHDFYCYRHTLPTNTKEQEVCSKCSENKGYTGLHDMCGHAGCKRRPVDYVCIACKESMCPDHSSEHHEGLCEACEKCAWKGCNVKDGDAVWSCGGCHRRGCVDHGCVMFADTKFGMLCQQCCYEMGLKRLRADY